MQTCCLNRLGIAPGRFQFGEMPNLKKMLAPLGRQRAPLRVVKNCHAAAGLQEGCAALDQSGALRDVAPGVVGDYNVERVGWQIDVLNVAQAKLHPVVEAGFLRLRHGAFVADGGDVHAEHLAVELLGEKARRAARAAAHVQNRRSGADPQPGARR